MIIVKAQKEVGGYDAQGNRYIWAHLECDSAADLPAPDYFKADAAAILAMGSTAHTIAENAGYELNSGGVWMLQEPGAATYTKAEIDSMIAAKQDAIADLASIRSGASAGATAVQQTEFETDRQRQETEIGAIANAGAKNLLNVTAQSTGIVTVNVDGTLTVNGSSASPTSVTLPSVWLKKGAYKISSGVQLPTDVFLSIRVAAGGETISVKGAVTEVVFDVPVDMTIDKVWLFVRENTSVDNLTIYPMIRRAEITDDTFVTYAPTNRELYEMILALQNGA